MSVLAFKALGYGAEQIPDKFFEKIPGGFFKPGDEKENGKKNRSPPREKSRRNSERSRRKRSPQNEYSDYSGQDTDFEDEQRRKERRRRKSTGRSTSRSLSRGRDEHHRSDVDGEHSDRDMAYPEQGQGQGPYFPPPPTSEYVPYSSQEHASRPSQGDYRPTSAQPQYGYPTQPSYGQTNYSQPPIERHDDTSPPAVVYGNEAAHRYEDMQNARAGQPRSASAARYTPGAGYAPSPAVFPAAPIPPPPVGVNSPPAGANAQYTPYAPYNPAAYATPDPAYPHGNGYASPPFYRQQSRSQPSFDEDQRQSSYNPRSSDQQVAPYDDRQSESRHRSTKHDRREHRHRARSADSRSSRRDKSRMSDMRERFDDMDLRTKNLGATVAGALAGGFAGRAAGKSRLTMLAGAAAGALGGQAIAARNVDRVKDEHGGRLPSRSRSRSRHGKHDNRDRSRDRQSGGGLRARSRSIIDRFRSKSRGREDREGRDRHYDSDSDDQRRRRDRSRDSRRPDRGYKVHEEYDYFTETDSEGSGSPVVERRKKTSKRRTH